MPDRIQEIVDALNELSLENQRILMECASSASIAENSGKKPELDEETGADD